MGMNTRSAPAFWASPSCTVKSALVSSGKVLAETTSRPISWASAWKALKMPVEYGSPLL